MNPIEHLWSHVKSQLVKYAVPSSEMKELWESTKDLWYAIPPELVQRYTHSMPNRVEELKKLRAPWTH